MLWLLLFLPWAGLVACAAWVTRTGRTKHFLPCAIAAWLATSMVFVVAGRPANEVVVGAAWLLLLIVLPQVVLLWWLIRRRARPLIMLVATTFLWVVQIPLAWVGLLYAGCIFLQQCL